MEFRAFGFQLLAHLNSDQEMLGNRTFVKAVGLTGQFELAGHSWD